MIDFRYHLVSIVAIFLALAIGIVLGTTALNGPVTKALSKTTGQLQNENQGLRASNSALQQQVAGANSFAQTAAPQLLAHQLDGQRVVVVMAPGAPSQLDSGVTTALKEAGATVTGQIAVQGQFFDTSAATQSYLDGLAQNLAAQVAPSGLALADGTPAQHAAQVLASAILARPGTATGSVATGSGGAGSPGSGADAPVNSTVLSGFGQAGFLTASTVPSTRATLALVITPAAAQAGPTASAANQVLSSMTTTLCSAASGGVLAGPTGSGATGGVLAAFRSGGGGEVSTVDDADTAIGQVTVSWAFARQLSSHQVGSYGTGAGASAIAPSPAPTPSPSPTASASAAAAGRSSR